MRPLVFALMLGCGGAAVDPNATATLSGTVTLVEGDCMPVTSPVTCVNSTPSRVVYLFPVQHFDESTHVFPTTVDATPIAQTTSDSNGHYSMRAPPGRWSVFVEDKGHLYARSYDSTDDAIDAVVLVDDAETTYDITIDHATW